MEARIIGASPHFYIPWAIIITVYIYIYVKIKSKNQEQHWSLIKVW